MAQNNQRTAEELLDCKFNYYLAYRIDPAEKDKTKIENKIKQARNDASGDVAGRRLTELRTDSIEVMVNDAVFDGNKYIPNSGGRQKELAAAKKFQLKDAVGVVEMLCRSRNMLLKSELEDIYRNAAKPVAFFTDKEFYAAIDYLLKTGVKVIDNVDSRIPFRDYEQAEQHLEPLKKADLYDFLGLSHTASADEIKSAKEKAYQQSTKISNDNKKKQSISAVCGDVQKILLVDAKGRATYDQYLLLKDKVWSEFQSRKDFSVKDLSLDEYEKYVQTTMDLAKVSVEQAEQIIGIGCKNFQLSVTGKPEGSNLEVCPYPECGRLYLKGAQSCPHCGKPLVGICWNCGAQIRIAKEDKGCANCGATNKGHELFNRACQNLDKGFNTPSTEIDVLKTGLLQIKGIVPDYAKNANSAIAKKVKDYETMLAARVKQEETIGVKYKEEVKKIADLTAQRHYQAAQSLAKSLPVKFNNYNVENSRKLLADINAVMLNAQRHVDAAKQYILSGNKAAAIASAAKALDICADHNDAKQIMQKFPPAPVTTLKVTAEKGRVRLEWSDNSGQEYAFYTIIKKIGVAPVGPDDGALVDSGLSVKFCEDENIVSATPYYYAVFAERYGVRSAIAVTNKPEVVFADVENMRQEVVDGGVKVTWEAPQNVQAVEVWKKSGVVAPAGVGDGMQVDGTLKGFCDDKCTQESAYLVICRYELNGKKVYSGGISAVYKPYEKITPLENIAVHSLGQNKYKFTCAPDHAGKLRLYYAEKAIAIEAGVPQKYLDFNKLCKGLQPVTVVKSANGEIEFMLPAGKICQLYPINSTEQLFIVSSPILINNIDGFTNVNVAVEEGTVRIKGVLHRAAERVIVKVSDGKHIEKIDEKGERFEYVADEVRKNGGFEIKIKANAISYISIFVEFKTDGVISYSPPVLLDPIDYREAITVLYSISYEVSSTAPFKLTLSFEADGEAELPDMLLMQGQPRPMDKNSGTLCERISGVVLKKKLFSSKYAAKRVIKVPPTAKNTKFALFLNESGGRVKIKEVRTL